MSVLYTDIGRVFTVLRYVISVYHVYGVCGYYVREYIYIYIEREREREERPLLISCGLSWKIACEIIIFPSIPFHCARYAT